MTEIKTLFPYQEKALSKLPAKAVMQWDMGTGKTLSAVYHYKRHAEGLPLLIIAPAAKTRRGEWEDELIAAGYNLATLDYRIVSRERFTAGKSGGQPLWREFAPAYNKGKQYAIIVDEAHEALRDSTSAFARRFAPVAKNAEFLLLLSATPIPNGWQDTLGYAVLFGYARNKTDFTQRHLIKEYKEIRVKGGEVRRVPQLVGIRDEELLEKWWKSVAQYLPRSEANELPPRHFIGVDFTDKPYSYTTIKKTRMRGEEMLDNSGKLYHALRQELVEHKLDKLNNIFQSTDENILVWYNYDAEREAILALLDKYHKRKAVYEVSGHAHTAPKSNQWASTKNSVTLCQYKSANKGIELTYATVSVYFSPTASWAEYSQSLGRNYRQGQSEKVLVYNFRTKDTVEEDIYASLKEKRDFNVDLWAESLDKE